MKTTRYFDHVRMRPDRTIIRNEWIAEAIDHAIETRIQSDGRIEKRVFIKTVGRYLRVIVLEDGETVHNAFFDRGYTEKGQ
ncbi:hypothetical protein MELA_01867 [Candidatus Methylomirabilis lanthanidiphila]|uniref:DUF4258 domain-containing protein n=1 Tax=Candidatus Methylomirabilis lanthanidiphila TaxID=2211376 RepID=A0A564ZLF8_9BACT|nr:hypothetical protein [Candidatus Methylomirabilis lanthanidiphila]VUZ85482.1 hypothetical protein MELA_01867 [Candidatus Methylomirabilis lanthanidiphila]